ncbi:MAG TPA: NF038122 family metalloprotease [Bryobacteraceae bacterium]|nr:NF038122 family metalloprotease [Bryobacteraceae bacterium]
MRRGSFLAGFAFRGIVLALAAIAASPARASSLTIIPTFNFTGSGLSASVVNSVESTINSAIAIYEADFANSMTIDITFSNATSGLGDNNTDLNPVSYATFVSALWTEETKAGNLAPLANLSETATTDPVMGNTTIWVKDANLDALGLSGLIDVPADPAGTINLNISQMTVDGGSYNLESVVEHEIDEVLGLGSGLDLYVEAPGTNEWETIMPEDLFRYASYNGTVTRSYTVSATSAYFSLNGITDLAQFNNPAASACKTNAACGDYGDWASGTGKVQVQNAFATPNTSPALGVELTALEAIGYEADPAPEPSTWALAGIGAALIGSVAWRRARGRKRAGPLVPAGRSH